MFALTFYSWNFSFIRILASLYIDFIDLLKIIDEK